MTVGHMRLRSHPVYLLSGNNTSGIGCNALNYLFASETGAAHTKQQRQSSQLLQSAQEHQSQKNSIKILVVDDEPDTLFTYESFLSDEGYDVRTFSDSQEAIKHFFHLPDPSSNYNLALLDIRMPKLNGLQLFHKMKALSPKIKIMFCSALDVAQEVTHILPGIEHQHFMRKPIEREQFINQIKLALNRE